MHTFPQISMNCVENPKWGWFLCGFVSLCEKLIVTKDVCSWLVVSLRKANIWSPTNAFSEILREPACNKKKAIWRIKHDEAEFYPIYIQQQTFLSLLNSWMRSSLGVSLSIHGISWFLLLTVYKLDSSCLSSTSPRPSTKFVFVWVKGTSSQLVFLEVFLYRMKCKMALWITFT